MSQPDIKPTTETLPRDVGVLAERMAGLKESMDDMKVQQRDLHLDNKVALADFKREVQANELAIREELRELRIDTNNRLTVLENRNQTQQGIVLGIRTLLTIVSVPPIAAMLVYLFTR